MKILMMGLGSIGQRHVRNIRKVLGEEAELIAYRARGNKTTFTDRLEIRDGIDLEKEYDIKAYTDLDEALAQKPDIAFITNITSKHVECAMKAAEAGCHIFMEKPLGSSLKGTEELKRLVDEKGLVFFMGFQNRYHPAVEILKKTVEEGKLGRIVYGECEFAERLTTMHRYEDYRTTYMARSDMGGGPVLNLLMHDLDIIRSIFGTPDSVAAAVKYASGLEIDVEEGASASFIWNGEDGFHFNVHTDMIQYPPSHRFKIVGEKGRAEADLNALSFTFRPSDGETEEKSWPDFQRNDMFIKELNYFLGRIKGDSTADYIGFEDGYEALKMAEGIKKAAGEKRETKI